LSSNTTSLDIRDIQENSDNIREALSQLEIYCRELNEAIELNTKSLDTKVNKTTTIDSVPINDG
jgi:hypothetical protein